MRSFYSNQDDLKEMISDNCPAIISLNELGTVIPNKLIKQLFFSYNIYTKEGTNSHGGVVLAVDKKLKCHLIDMNEPNIIAVQTLINNKEYVIASIYSPPAERLPIKAMTTLLNQSKNIILIGDLNAKHQDWGCPGYQVNPKGRVLAEWLINHNLNVLNAGLKTSLRSDTTIDLLISTEIPESCECRTLPYTAALKLRVTVWQEVKRKRPSISPSLRILLRHKHYLQNRYRHTKHEEDRLRLRSWNYLVKHEFKSHRQRTWEQFISTVASPNPTSFWRTVKKLNKKKSVDFAALTEEKMVHKNPVNIVKCLTQHFTERHSPPKLDMMNSLDKEAYELWKLYSTADTDDIELVSHHSDLQFNIQDLKKTIGSLKNKNSSGFDHVSNKMIKLLPTHY
ncbi:unnamed protein product [Adineta steineri]|nr:unnamed protein product [Adineta steineri]